MSTLKKHEEPVVDIECWDDDDLEVEGHEFGFRGASITTSNAPSHRDSISSRHSFRSEYESNFGDENKEFLLPGDDDGSTMDAIAAATKAGVPIPKGVPASALMGGTIKRLGGKKVKRVIEDDWEVEMDLPNLKDSGLKFKYQDHSNFPDNLRRVSGPFMPRSSPAVKTLQPAPKFDLSQFSDSHNSSLDRFREQDDDSDFFGDGLSTIKIPKRRQPHKSIIPTDTDMPSNKKDVDDLEDDMEEGLEFPDGPLTLSARRDIPPKTPSQDTDDFDWGDGSLGTRFGGTRRDMRSTRSSSVSGMSPSVSSSFTMESEDEDLKGLVFPPGPLRFSEILEKRQQDRSPDRLLRQPMKQSARPPPGDEDFLKGLEIGDGDVFTTKAVNFNRNVQVRPIRQNSPTRTKTAVSLTFTNKPSVHSRLSRANTERPSMSLEPVLESGGSIVNKASKFQSRLSHSAQSSVSSTTTPTTPSSTQSGPPHISTPRRRELRSKPSALALGRKEPTTTSAQLLKSKRSMPTLSTYNTHNRSPPKPVITRLDRPASRADNLGRFNSRPKTPVDRFNTENNLPGRKFPPPFLAGGATQSQSHHVMNKASRYPRRNDSGSSNTSAELRPASRAFSRSGMRSPSPPHRLHHSKTTEALAREAAAKRTLSKPIKKRNYGDGGELDAFDDLPTSQQVEQKYMKQPSQRGPPKAGSLRKRLGQNTAPERASTPAFAAAFSPPKNENLPRFARDTNASRIAREQVLAQRAPSAAVPIATVSNNLKSHARSGFSSPSQNTIRPKKGKKPQQQLKPHLIKPLGNTHTHPKAVNGMVYNVQLCRWEGNENDLSPFEPDNMTPRPALISNVNGLNGPQLSGGMFFDPRHMTWFKLPNGPSSIRSEGHDTMDGFDAFDDDTFKDIPDLKDNPSEADESGVNKSGVNDDWLVGEEFDVGPQFIRSQNEEEDRWRRKCEKWCGSGWLESDGEGNWRWVVRHFVNQE